MSKKIIGNQTKGKKMPLDKGRDYGQVYGMPGVAYEQDGKLYRNDGKEFLAETILPEPSRPPVFQKPELPAAVAPVVEEEFPLPVMGSSGFYRSTVAEQPRVSVDAEKTKPIVRRRRAKGKTKDK